MTTYNVLVFPAGEVNSVELHDALAMCVNVKVFGASSVERHGKYVFENYIPGLPRINEPGFIEAFNKVLADNQINVIFPTHDTVVRFFAEHAKEIAAKVVGADKGTAEICRDKVKTYEALKGHAFIPKTYSEGPYPFPVFVKPREGQGGVGARIVRREEDLPEDLENWVVCEYLPGEEYTVDCFTGCHGEVKVVSPRSRTRTLAGISVAGSAESLTPEIGKIAEAINSRLSFLGLWYFQIKRDAEGRWKLLEVSARCAGAMCLTRARGLNLPLMSVYAAMGIDVVPMPNECPVSMDRTLIARYSLGYDYDTVYFDFDDTLIVRGKVNLKAIWFLYQCRNNGKKVVLLTKHAREIYESMKRFAIAESLFSEIIHIGPDDRKSCHVNPERAIFIDNAYWERKDVHDVHGIPVFDVDAIEVLMDWRI